MKSDDNANAETELKKEIALDPNLPDAYEQLGEFYLKVNRYDEAEKALLQALRLNPQNARVPIWAGENQHAAQPLSAGPDGNRRGLASRARQPECSLCAGPNPARSWDAVKRRRRNC